MQYISWERSIPNENKINSLDDYDEYDTSNNNLFLKIERHLLEEYSEK